MDNSTTKLKTYSIDYESFYSSDYGIEELGLWHYIHDDRFNAYLVAIWGEDIQWVGHPKDFDWSLIAGADEFISHNFTFDSQVHERCIELGVIPKSAMPKKWLCSANMCVALGGPRNLKDASEYMLGVTLSKEMRNWMKGKTWEDAIADGKDGQLKAYALDDAKYCYALWQKYNSQWSETERSIANLTFQQTRRGLAVDVALLESSLPKVEKARDEALAKIPWVGMLDENGDEQKPLGVKSLKTWLKKEGITPPPCTEAKDPAFMQWQKDNENVEVVKAMQTYRSANALAMKGNTVRRQVRPDGRYGFTSLYYGATTGRRSGGYEDDRNKGGGVNVLNLTKNEMFGLDLRRVFIAPKGKKFVVLDFEQAEPRTAAWLSEDTEFLTLLKSGVPLYEAHARSQGAWSGDKVLKTSDAKLYLQKKIEVLGLGYGAGWAKLIYICESNGAVDCLLLPITEKNKMAFQRYIARTNQQDKVKDFKTDLDWTKAVNAWLIVSSFRASKPKLTGLWKRLEKDCWNCSGTDYKIELPSGRLLRYFNVKTQGGLTVQKTLGAPPIKIWGGFLTENLVQATARDVLCNAMLNAEKDGITTIFDVYDELICEVDTNFDKNILRDIMQQTPDFMPGLPLSVSVEETDYYKK